MSSSFQGQLATLTRKKRFDEHSLILVFEGVDAAGKGGAIRRVTAALDARQYVTVPVAAPTDEERAHPYLWRFWRHIPGHGGITIFDRSWYGRVLVERVEGYAAPADWMRAYDEINQFEEQLVDAGAIVVKFWLQIEPGRAAPPLSGAREDAVQALQDHRRTTGATGRSGTPTKRPSATWSIARAPRSRRGRWSRPKTSALRGSRS